MNCPKCDAVMERVPFAGITVDRCTVCKGLWFDEFELKDLKEVGGSAAIDTGDPAVGAEYNKIDRIDCPKCKTKMIRMVDLDQPHIWYESCAVCGGSFLDAGEFKDMTERTLSDIVKDLLGRERK